MTDDVDGARSARDHAEVAIRRRVTRPDLNVWTYLAPADELRDAARRIDAWAADGVDLPLAGVSFAVKDNTDVAGVPTTAGCRAFAYTPERSAPVVERLLAAGALFVGKTNLDQFATGLVGVRSPDFGICANPIDPTYIAGGSSSGSAVAVATGMVELALGTDTAGSGRVPAACCGIVGLKPTRDLVSTAGVVPASRSLDCVSLFARSSAEVATAFGVVGIEGTRSPDGTPPRLTAAPSRLRVGVPLGVDWFGDHDARVLFDRAVDRMADTGAELVPFDVAPFVDVGRLLYGSALVAERAAAFGEFASKHPSAMDPTVGAIVTGAAAHTAVDVFRALELLAAGRVHTLPTWRTADVIALPTIARHPTIAAVLEDPFGPNAELGMYTSFVNLLDLAALAVPAGTRANGLPFGISLVAPALGEPTLFALAAALTEAPDAPPAPHPSRTRLAVVGAHLSGQPLNHQLQDLGARLVAATTTAPAYRLFDLGTTPARPGMVREPATGAAIEVEVWELDPAGLGAFLARVPAPLAIGSVELADHSLVLGFLCEPHALAGARDITGFGGWRAYRDATAPAQPSE